jgi:signal transduction histidine kinase
VNGLPSIAGRLARTLLASSLLWSLAVSLAVWLAVRHEVGELLDDTLQGAAEAMRPSLEGEVLPSFHAGGQPPGSDRYAWQVVSHAGGAPPRVIAHSSRAPVQAFVATPTAGFVQAPEWRVFGTALGRDGRMLYVAQSRAEQLEAALEVGFDAALATLAVALLAHLWLRARAVHELAPVQRLSQRLQGHDLLSPGATLGPAERAELQPVHAAIDALAAQLARRLAAERAFSAHAAHSLRTPLAGIDAQLAMALREAPPTLHPRLQRVRAAAGRLQRVVAALLALFRSGVELQREPQDLAALLARLPAEGLEVVVQPGTRIVADVDLLSAALLNLLDNAVRHGATRLTIWAPAPGRLRLQDDGPGVDAARRQALQAAIDDCATDDAGGGLGLMLASLVARAHGGRLLLPASDQGFAVELVLAASDA